MKIFTNVMVIGIAALLSSACSGTVGPREPQRGLNEIVTTIRQSVVTVAAYDLDGSILRLGSGFFIDRDGVLVTNYHVLDGAYNAEIKTAAGEIYAVRSVIARDQLVDLMKVRVEIPRQKAVGVLLAKNEPNLADRVVVIGSPMGLDQTISEGIVSAVRKHPTSGNIYQLTAPISQGSSGSPALNLNGEVIGVVTFQAAKGQNLNFAVSVKTLQAMPQESVELSLAEWTLQKAGEDPLLAANLCRQGAQLSIRGKYEAALNYFQQATETNPDDPDAWHGLGSCYIGLNKPDEAIEAYHRSIEADPENATPYFMLAMYHKILEQDPQAIASLLQVIRINPQNMQAHLELAAAYERLNQTEAQINALQRALQIEPGNVTALHRMGQTMGRLGRYDEALELLLEASRKEPDNAPIHFDIGVTYHFKKQPQKELKAYTRALRADPKLARAHHNIGVLFLEQGNHKLALREYEILKNLDKELAELLFNRIYPETLEEVSEPRAVNQ